MNAPPHPRIKAIEIFESYVSPSAPSNASPARRGYGLTPGGAHRAAEHWANQAPFTRTRRVTVTDGTFRPECERIARAVCGLSFDYDGPRDAGDRRREQMIRRGLAASAILDSFTEAAQTGHFGPDEQVALDALTEGFGFVFAKAE